MKITIYLVIVMILLSSALYAQVPSKPFNVYISGGLTALSAPQEFKDLHKMGYNLSAAVGYKAYPMVQLIGKLEYHGIPKDYDEIFGSGDEIKGGTREFFIIGLDARLDAPLPSSPTKPFLFIGAGLAHISQTAFETNLDYTQTAPLEFENETKLYFNIGGGIEYKTTAGLAFFIQGRYLNIKQDGDNLVLIPVSVGIKF